jgi:hypothetical protein
MVVPVLLELLDVVLVVVVPELEPTVTVSDAVYSLPLVSQELTTRLCEPVPTLTEELRVFEYTSLF